MTTTPSVRRDKGRGLLWEILLVWLFFTPVGPIWFSWWLLVDVIGRPLVRRMRSG